jgi:hypothetical protein
VKTSRQRWRELSWITAAYLVGQLLYAYFIEHSVSENAFGDLPALLKPGKKEILFAILYVALTSWPLAISAATIGYNYVRSELITAIIFFAIVLPFAFNALVVDSSVGDSWARTSKLSGSYTSPPQFIFDILTSYFRSYRLPLFLASISYGFWAGREVGEISLSRAPDKSSSE